MSEFRRRLMAVKKEELKTNEILAIYDVTSTSSATRILGNSFKLSHVTKMKIDGVKVTPTKTNWQNSQYYQEDSATALSKNITIK